MTRWLDPQWLARGVDALRATLDVDGDHKRQMIQFLYDEGFWDTSRLSWEGAVARFNDCLNPAKPQFFKVGELWALMKRFRRYEIFEVMAADLGFELRRIPTDARREALMERIDAGVASLNAMLAELHRLDDSGGNVHRLTPPMGAEGRAAGAFSRGDEPPHHAGGF